VFKNIRKKTGSKTQNTFNWEGKNNELVALINDRKIEEALSLGQSLVEYVDRTFRRDAAQKATSYNNMGMAFMMAEDYELADRCFREALEMRKRLYGKDHNEVAVILLNMVQLYRIQAEAIFRANRVETE